MVLVMLLQLLLIITFTEGLFFPTIGFGGSNCQCPTSCASPPPGCFCARPSNQNCQSNYPSYQQQPQPASYVNHNQYNFAVYPSAPATSPIPAPFASSYHSVPSPPPPLPPPPPPAPYRQTIDYPIYDQHLHPQPQPVSPVYKQPQSKFVDHQTVQLKPPSQLQQQYVNQLMKEFEHDSGASYPSTNEFIETKIEVSPTGFKSATENNNNNDNDGSDQITADSVREVQDNHYHNLQTTEIKITQTPYEEDITKEGTPNQLHSNEYKPSNPDYPVSKREPIRGEGVVGSGYTYNDITASTLSPVTLEYMNEASKTDSFELNESNEINEFKKDVDRYEHESSSTVAIPSSNNIEEDQNDKTRSARNSNELEQEEVAPNQSFNDFMDTSKNKAFDEKHSKCNNLELQEAMHKKMTPSPSISKQMIYSAASEMFPGRSVNVICSKHSFSYIVVTSPVFCEHRKRPITCFAFFQP